MKLVTSALLIGLAQVSKIILGLVIIKLIAIYLGPEGLGKLGHLISLVTFLAVISGGGIENGIVKYVSEYKDKPFHLVNFIHTSVIYALIFSLFILVSLGVFSREIALFLFLDASLYWVVIFIGFIQFLMAFNKVVSSVANGFKNTKVFAISQITGNLLSIPLIWWLVYSYGFIGGTIAVTVSFIIMFFPCFYFYKNSVFYKHKGVKFKSFKSYNKLYGFSLMALVSAITFPVVEVYIREMMIAGSGYEQAGIWQATIKISSVYVGFFGLFLAYYFVPSVSPLVCNKNIKIIVWKYMSLIGTFFGASALVFYIGRDVFIEFLLSDEFLELSSLIHLQLIGDFFKILAFVVGFVFVAKAAVWIYITAEILQGFFLILFSSILYSLNPEIQSILKAYVLTNIIFFFSTLAVFYFYIKTSKFRGVS